jgi:hypothetical protein
MLSQGFARCISFLFGLLLQRLGHHHFDIWTRLAVRAGIVSTARLSRLMAVWAFHKRDDCGAHLAKTRF